MLFGGVDPFPGCEAWGQSQGTREGSGEKESPVFLISRFHKFWEGGGVSGLGRRLDWSVGTRLLW